MKEYLVVPSALINGLRGTCKKGHTVDVSPKHIALGHWYCSECKEWIQARLWKIHRFYDPPRSQRIPKEIPQGYELNKE